MCLMPKTSNFQISQKLIAVKHSKLRLRLQSLLLKISQRSKHQLLQLPQLLLPQAWSSKRTSLKKRQRRRRPSQLSQRLITKTSPPSFLP